jgi:hypothetical protein
MNETVNFTLLAEGSSDRALLPILEWLLSQHVSASTVIAGDWVDTNRLPRGKISKPRDRLRSAIDVYPCDILFIHRDGDGGGLEARRVEIDSWLREAQLGNAVSSVRVIPIRKCEAWLLVDEQAIRRAASNPNGSMPLSLPKTHEIEGMADPKDVLFKALVTASGLSGRRLKKFDRNQARSVVAKHMTQHAVLRQLAAFRELDTEIREVCSFRGWV